VQTWDRITPNDKDPGHSNEVWWEGGPNLHGQNQLVCSGGPHRDIALHTQPLVVNVHWPTGGMDKITGTYRVKVLGKRNKLYTLEQMHSQQTRQRSSGSLPPWPARKESTKSEYASTYY